MKHTKMVFGTGSSTGKKFTSLVVDDDPIVRRIHKALLTKLGFETQVVENGKEAVDLFHSGSFFNLIFMDLEMPIMNGIEATKELRAMGVKSMIVGVTSRDLDSEKQAFMGAGLDDCYVKPLTADKIAPLLQELNKNY